MSAATTRKLRQFAEALSTPERQVSPMQVAAQLLEEAVRRVGSGADRAGHCNRHFGLHGARQSHSPATEGTPSRGGR